MVAELIGHSPDLGIEAREVSLRWELQDAVAELVAAGWSPCAIRDMVDEALLESIEEG